MKRLAVVGLISAGLVLAMTAVAGATTVGDFLADSNQFGYQGTVQNVTRGTAAVAIPTSRDAVVWFVNEGSVPDPLGYSGYSPGNAIESNWYQHPQSDANAGFFQLNDGGTVTSATGVWTKVGSTWDFTLTVTGANATYANSYSRLWQPDINDAWGGTFTNYTYTLTATGMTTTVAAGWRTNTDNPTGITGSFDATFLLTYAGDSHPDGNSLAGAWDTYSAHLTFSDAYWNGTGWGTGYPNSGGPVYSTFGAPVPEPISMIFFGTGLVAVGGFVARRRMQQRKEAGSGF